MSPGEIPPIPIEVSFTKRSHPFGATRKAKVIREDSVVVKGETVRVLLLFDEIGEGHVLVGTGSDDAHPGDKGVLTFTEGGPTGGFWKFTKQ